MLAGELLGTFVLQYDVHFFVAGGLPMLEHPADRNKHPYPSVFANPEFEWLQRHTDMNRRYLDQCMFGCSHRKPTEIAIGNHTLVADIIDRVFEHPICQHTGGHKPLLGRGPGGKFRTAAAAAYPPKLSYALAEIMVDFIQFRWKPGQPPGHGSAVGPWENSWLPFIRTARGSSSLSGSGGRLQL